MLLLVSQVSNWWIPEKLRTVLDEVKLDVIVHSFSLCLFQDLVDFCLAHSVEIRGLVIQLVLLLLLYLESLDPLAFVVLKNLLICKLFCLLLLFSLLPVIQHLERLLELVSLDVLDWVGKGLIHLEDWRKEDVPVVCANL